ncbi:ComF family protein, partial [bacterium]
MRRLWHWLDFLFPPREDEVALRDVSADDFLSLMHPVLVPETRPGTVALLPFHARHVRAAIHEAKYHGDERAFGFLAGALADYLLDADDVGRTTSHIVPVPLGRVRRKERGFNQIEEVARRALRSLGDHFILDTGLLERVKETQSQVSLARRKREENMRGAFVAAHRLDPACTYIVLDDVITTGATLQAAIDALREAGAVHIIPLA